MIRSVPTTKITRAFVGKSIGSLSKIKMDTYNPHKEEKEPKQFMVRIVFRVPSWEPSDLPLVFDILPLNTLARILN